MDVGQSAVDSRWAGIKIVSDLPLMSNPNICLTLQDFVGTIIGSLQWLSDCIPPNTHVSTAGHGISKVYLSWCCLHIYMVVMRLDTTSRVHCAVVLCRIENILWEPQGSAEH